MKKVKQRASSSPSSSLLIALQLPLFLSFLATVESFASFPLNANSYVQQQATTNHYYGHRRNQLQHCMVKWDFWKNDGTTTKNESEKEENVVVNGQQKNNGKSDNMFNPSASQDDVGDQLSEILLYRMSNDKKRNQQQDQSAASSISKNKYPFVIDVLDPNSQPEIYKDAAEVCVEVFFNPNDEGAFLGGNGKNAMSPFKAMQLMYLRNMQYGDLRGRRLLSNAQNSMIVARQVIPSSSASSSPSSDEIISDLSTIYNSDWLPDGGETGEYTRGDYLGFVEVTERSFGLGKKFDEEEGEEGEEVGTVYVEENDEGKAQKPKKKQMKLRPLLTNLSVRSDARQSGIGSALLTSAERSVLTWNKPSYNEVILQVEDDNPNALQFYEKRGYATVFADPSCRRFATGDLMLRKERCTKIAMRKALAKERAIIENDKVRKDGQGGIGDMLRKLPFFG
uniref:N-acetyltransferase domain-containing protein n=2 Tax=Ditylum brightwellii TaxID=49249 RepID=A0A7S1ZAS1_9STRA